MQKYKLNSHKWHNPNCDIVEAQIDGDSYLTYVVYVTGPLTGQEFMEYYRGETYQVGSRLMSWSRCWSERLLPKKWRPLWLKAKRVYEEQWMGKEHERGVEYLFYETEAKK